MSLRQPSVTPSVTSPVIKDKAPDGGWGWAVVFGAFMVGLTCDGYAYNTGILLEKFLIVYKESVAITTLFDSFMTGMLFAIGPVASGLTAAYGCKTISILGSFITAVGMLTSIAFDSIYCHALTLGIITGSGLGLIHLPQIVIINYWFNKRISVAIGISVCGTGIGIAIFAVLTEVMIDTFGWKGSMLIMSGIMFTNVFFSSLFRTPGETTEDIKESQTLKNALKETLNFKILTEPLFLYYGFANFLNGTVYYGPIVFLKDHIRRVKLSSTNHETVKIMVIFGLSGAFSRVLFGCIAEKDFLNRTIIYALSVLSCGLAIGLIGWVGNNLTMLTIGIMFYGIAEGGYVCLFPVVMVDLFGVEKVSNVFGITNLILGVASVIGPPLIAQTLEESTGYKNGFYVSSLLTIISGVLLIFLPIIHRKYKSADI